MNRFTFHQLTWKSQWGIRPNQQQLHFLHKLWEGSGPIILRHGNHHRQIMPHDTLTCWSLFTATSWNDPFPTGRKLQGNYLQCALPTDSQSKKPHKALWEPLHGPSECHPGFSYLNFHFFVIGWCWFSATPTTKFLNENTSACSPNRVQVDSGPF